MKNKCIRNLLVAAGLISASAVASAQVFVMDQVTVTEGTTSVALNWEFTYEFDGVGTPISSVGFDLFFDEVIITGADITNCIIEADAQSPGCVIVGAGDQIRMAITNFNAAVPIGNANGVIVFTIADDAEAGDVSNIVTEAVGALLSPPDTVVDITAGSVTIVDTDAVLTLTPDSFDFGTQDILDPAQTANFTIGNDGEQDSLTITAASIGSPRGVAAPFSVTPNCDGVELAPGATCVVTVTFDPQVAGVYSDVLRVTSDAGEVTAALAGEATATANVIINPPFGPVNLGVGLQGETLTANGSVQNTGSADATASCSLVGSDVFSTSLPLDTTITIAAGAPAIPFTVSCALPTGAEDGDTFAGEIQCSIDGAPVSADTTHFLSCGVSEFEPLPVPTMQKWSIILFAMLMLLVGGISIRMFRA